MTQRLPTLLLIVFGIIIHMPANAQWEAMAECNKSASDVNAQLPMQLDAATPWTNVICTPGGEGVIARYSYILHFPTANLYPRYIKDTVFTGMVNTWCTDPAQRAMLDHMDVETVYFRPDGSFITSLRITPDMC